MMETRKPTDESVRQSSSGEHSRVLELARQAAELLQAPIFESAVNGLMDHYGSQILATQPHEKNLREQLHAEYQVLAKVVGMLKGYIQHYETIQAQQMQAAHMRADAASYDRDFG